MNITIIWIVIATSYFISFINTNSWCLWPIFNLKTFIFFVAIILLYSWLILIINKEWLFVIVPYIGCIYWQSTIRTQIAWIQRNELFTTIIFIVVIIIFFILFIHEAVRFNTLLVFLYKINLRIFFTFSMRARIRNIFPVFMFRKSIPVKTNRFWLIFLFLVNEIFIILVNDHLRFRVY